MIAQFKNIKSSFFLAKNWLDLLGVAKEVLDKKIVIAYAKNGAVELLSQPKYLKLVQLIDVWIFGSSEGLEIAEHIELRHLLIKEDNIDLEEFVKQNESLILSLLQTKRKKTFFKTFQKQVPNPPKRNKFMQVLLGNKPELHIEFQFVKGPWGGGNQFLKALKKQLEETGWLVKQNARQSVALFNSFQYEEKNIPFLKKAKAIHRIDGPMRTSRGVEAANLDDELFKVNAEVADCTVFQSFWSLESTLNLGYKPVNPVVIPNACDAEIFNRKNKAPFSKNRKIKLVATSWSTNPKKGGVFYKWLDENLDFTQFEFTFVGRSSETYEHIKMIPAVTTDKLGPTLKAQDIYITASANEACSNSLIEALTCGLPAIYLKSGSHPELVKKGGLGFDNAEEIPTILQEIIDNYQVFQENILVQSIGEISKKYESCFNL